LPVLHSHLVINFCLNYKRYSSLPSHKDTLSLVSASGFLDGEISANRTSRLNERAMVIDIIVKREKNFDNDIVTGFKNSLHLK